MVRMSEDRGKRSGAGTVADNCCGRLTRRTVCLDERLFMKAIRPLGHSCHWGDKKLVIRSRAKGSMQRTGGPTGASGTDSGQPTPALTVNQQHEREKDRPYVWGYMECRRSSYCTCTVPLVGLCDVLQTSDTERTFVDFPFLLVSVTGNLSHR